MNNLEALEKWRKELGEEIEKLKKEKDGFDFREWYDCLVCEGNVGQHSFDVFANNHWFDGYKTEEEAIEANNRRVAEYIISEHFKRIVGDWKPDWSYNIQWKYFLYYYYENNKIEIDYHSDIRYYPNWFYFPKDKKDEILAEVERMKTLYGVDIVKYYLTGER
jgi:hypothetical protein